jgi:hypothetical protein
LGVLGGLNAVDQIAFCVVRRCGAVQQLPDPLEPYASDEATDVFPQYDRVFTPERIAVALWHQIAERQACFGIMSARL